MTRTITTVNTHTVKKSVYFFRIDFEKEKISKTRPIVINRLNNMNKIIPVRDSESNKFNSCCMCVPPRFYFTIDRTQKYIAVKPQELMSK